MLINNVELSSLGITLYDRVLSTNTVKTTQEWLDGDIQPTFIRQQEGFKNMQLSFLLLTNSEEEAFMKISQLTRLLKDIFQWHPQLWDNSLLSNKRHPLMITIYTVCTQQEARQPYTSLYVLTNSCCHLTRHRHLIAQNGPIGYVP